MSRPGFLRWFGWSAAAHLAVGSALWIGLPKADPTNLPAPDAAVTMVALIEAPTEDPAAPAPRRVARHASRPVTPIEHAPPAATEDHPRPEPIFDAALAAPVPTEPDTLVALSDPAPDSTEQARLQLPLPEAPQQVSDEDGSIPAEISANAGVPTDAYRPLVLAMLERAKRYPLVADRWRLEGTVDIAFTIHPDGRLSDPELIASSTHPILDDAALAIVRRVRYVPPPPSQASIRFSALIRYQVDQ
ncbi:MAG TPA: energy transducer TonB [Nitrospiria bacterium]|nr:energy transducer TonB [Nitrospiria bacterium]